MAPRRKKADSSENLLNTDDAPPSINPYRVLSLDKAATQDQIKSAYRKAALKNHPDKVPPSEKPSATETFQQLAFAYAILSSPSRRACYDATGSTAESVSISGSDGEFSWSAYYATQFAEVVTSAAIAAVTKEYKGSEEERDDILEAYTRNKGRMEGVYESVMLSDVRDDEERYRGWIDGAIAEGRVKGYKAYTGETETQRRKRIEMAGREEEEAMELAEELGIRDRLFGGKNGKEDGEDGLRQLILKRQDERMGFLEQLEAKYKDGGGKQGKRMTNTTAKARKMSEPSEEEFQAAAEKLKKKGITTSRGLDGESRSKRAKTK